jgi:hypothetical protein
MITYRLYEVDQAGHVSEPPRVIQSRDDGAALAEAKKHVDGRAIEVWKGGERIGLVQPGDA